MWREWVLPCNPWEAPISRYLFQIRGTWRGDQPPHSPPPVCSLAPLGITTTGRCCSNWQDIRGSDLSGDGNFGPRKIWRKQSDIKWWPEADVKVPKQEGLAPGRSRWLISHSVKLNVENGRLSLSWKTRGIELLYKQNTFLKVKIQHTCLVIFQVIMASCLRNWFHDTEQTDWYRDEQELPQNLDWYFTNDE